MNDMQQISPNDLIQNKTNHKQFGSTSGDKKKVTVDPEVIKLKNSIKNILGGIKSIEDKILRVDKKVQVIENNLLIIKKRLNIETKSLSSRIVDADKNIDIIKKNIVEIIGDLKNFARVEEVGTIRKYLELWEPLNFITRKELYEILNEQN